jgi:hypothetical protein
LVTLGCFAQQQSQTIDLDYKYQGEPYYPGQSLRSDDSLNWPMVLDISIDIKDIKNIDLKNDEFFAKLIVSSYSEYQKSYVSLENDTLDLSHEALFAIYIKENNLSDDLEPIYYQNSENYEYLFYDNFKTKSVKLVEAPFDINWNLRDFPFDKQELKFKFTTTLDTTVIKLRPSKIFPSSYNSNLENLKDGYNVEGLSYNYSYNQDNGDLILISPGERRGIVTESLEIILTLDRQGSWLFLKLFLGGIISFLISCLIFLLPIKSRLESKINLGVGGIFGAIGNRYYVDSVLPEIQVFTKADAVSNLVIFMVFLNILVMVLQQSEKTYFPYFQSTKNALYYSIYSFCIIFIAILLY